MRSLLWIAAALATLTFVATGDAWAGRGGCGGGGRGGHRFGGRHSGGCGYEGCGGCGSGCYSDCGGGRGGRRRGSRGGYGCGSGCCSVCGGYGYGAYASVDGDATVVAEAQDEQPTATLVVKLPADAKLFVDNRQTISTSGVRVLETPGLAAGAAYHYTLRAEVTRNGQTQTVTKVVHFRAGEEKNVTLDIPTEAVASR